MAKQYAKAFYNSKAWQMCRKGFLETHPLCEECLKRGEYKPAYIVHHKIHITPDNINRPDVVLNWTNLESVCHDCHNDIHKPLNTGGNVLGNKRYTVDVYGRVVSRK